MSQAPYSKQSQHTGWIRLLKILYSQVLNFSEGRHCPQRLSTAAMSFYSSALSCSIMCLGELPSFSPLGQTIPAPSAGLWKFDYFNSSPGFTQVCQYLSWNKDCSQERWNADSCSTSCLWGPCLQICFLPSKVLDCIIAWYFSIPGARLYICFQWTLCCFGSYGFLQPISVSFIVSPALQHIDYSLQLVFFFCTVEEL